MEVSRSAVSWILRVRGAITEEEGSCEGSEGGREPRVGYFIPVREAACSISLRLIESAFVRDGVIILHPPLR